MLLENHFLRQKKQKKQLLVTILVTMFLLFFSFVLLFTTNRHETDNFVLGASYTIVGELKQNDNYPFYTHSISSGDLVYYVHSPAINLNAFSDQTVSLRGVFLEKKDKKNIFDIRFLKTPDQSMIYSQKRYIFPGDLLFIDTKEDNNISAKKQ